MCQRFRRVLYLPAVILWKLHFWGGGNLQFLQCLSPACISCGIQHFPEWLSKNPFCHSYAGEKRDITIDSHLTIVRFPFELEWHSDILRYTSAKAQQSPCEKFKFSKFHKAFSPLPFVVNSPKMAVMSEPWRRSTGQQWSTVKVLLKYVNAWGFSQHKLIHSMFKFLPMAPLLLLFTISHSTDPIHLTRTIMSILVTCTFSGRSSTCQET